MTDHDDRRLRQYLLGVLPDEQCTAVEEEYFGSEDALDRVWAVEHDLIDDYLAARLDATDREHFDRHYLATPVHQHRVATARQLRDRSASDAFAPKQTPALTPAPSIVDWLFQRPTWAMAIAAVVVLTAIGSAWLIRGRLMSDTGGPPTQTAIPQQPPRPETPTAPPALPSPVLFAVSLSPTGVRSGDNAPPITIPSGTDRVSIHLESDGARPRFTDGRATIHTVSGREVWQGAATAETAERGLALAHVDVPADRLPSDDYVVALFERETSGRETEVFRYFLRVRAR